jgi:hypothetical protein
MIRPWYRSRLFWLGLPGLVFMLWLWLAKAGQSFHFGHAKTTGAAEMTYRVIGASAGSIFQNTSRSYYNGSLPLGFYWGGRGLHGSGSGLDPDEPVTYFPRPFGIIREARFQREGRKIQLAWWVVISTYMAVWLGALAGWQRRKARLSRRAAAEMPGS